MVFGSTRKERVTVFAVLFLISKPSVSPNGGSGYTGRLATLWLLLKIAVTEIFPVIFVSVRAACVAPSDHPINKPPVAGIAVTVVPLPPTPTD